MRRYKRTVNTDQLLDGFANFLKMGFYLDGDQRFTNEQHMHRVWVKHRDKIMAQYQPGGSEYSNKSPGQMPYGWWVFELKELPPSGYYEQTRRLLELGKLSYDNINLIKRDQHIADLIAGKDNTLRRLFGIDKVVYLNQDKGEMEDE